MKQLLLCVGLLLGSMFSMDTSALPPQNFFRFVRLEANEQGQLYLATNRGLYLKADDKAPWREISPPGARRLHVQTLALNLRGDVAAQGGLVTYVLRHGSSAWVAIPDVEGMDQPRAAGDAFFALGNQGRLWRADGVRWVSLSNGPWRSELEATDLAWIWDTLYLATDQGLLESLDGGRSWRRSPGAESLGTSDILLSSQGQWLYASSQNRTLGQEHLPSVFVRHQRDGAWRRFAANTRIDHRVFSAALLAATGPIAYVKLTGGIPARERWFRVRDGQDWTEIDLGFAKERGNLWQLLVTPRHLYALTDDVIYRSADQGSSWEPFVVSMTPPFLP